MRNRVGLMCHGPNIRMKCHQLNFGGCFLKPHENRISAKLPSKRRSE